MFRSMNSKLRLSYIFLLVFTVLFVQSCSYGKKRFLGIKEGEFFIKTNRSEKKNYKIFLLVPLSGKYEKSGNNIVDAVFKALYDLKVENVSISMFDTGSNDEMMNKQTIRYAINQIKPDIVIGPLLKNHVEEIKNLAVLNKDVKFFILSNSDFSNLTTLIRQNNSYDADYFSAISRYVRSADRGNFALLFPKEKFKQMMNLRAMLEKEGLNVMFFDLFDSDNENTYKKVINGFKNNYRKINIVDKKGNLIKNNIKNKIEIKDQEGEYDYRYELVDTVYIDGKSDDLLKIIAEMENEKLLEKDIIIFTNDEIIEEGNLKLRNIDNVFFVSKVDAKLSNFYSDFYHQFSYKPLKISLNAYDISSLCLYLIENNMLSDENIDFNYGFDGVLGKFRYKNGKLERVFNVYRIRGKTIELIDQGNFYN